LVSSALQRSTPKRLVHLAGRAEREFPLQSKAAFRVKNPARSRPCLHRTAGARDLARNASCPPVRSALEPVEKERLQ
jgi:hypothetical protein